LVKEPRGKSRKEVRKALEDAHSQGLVKIVSDDGAIDR
jgi:DNA-binding transcriptional regulator LsrR (DeoR family)